MKARELKELRKLSNRVSMSTTNLIKKYNFGDRHPMRYIEDLKDLVNQSKEPDLELNKLLMKFISQQLSKKNKLVLGRQAEESTKKLQEILQKTKNRIRNQINSNDKKFKSKLESFNNLETFIDIKNFIQKMNQNEKEVKLYMDESDSDNEE